MISTFLKKLGFKSKRERFDEQFFGALSDFDKEREKLGFENQEKIKEFNDYKKRIGNSPMGEAFIRMYSPKAYGYPQLTWDAFDKYHNINQ